MAQTLASGVLVGVVATQVLDWISISLYEREDRDAREAENLARSGRHAYEQATAQMARALGRELDEEAIRKWGWRFHKAFGIFGGIQYMLARRFKPEVGAGLGLAFGAAFFLLVDEGLVPLMRWTPGPRAFSWKVHARGAVSHLAYGIAAEATARGIDAVA